MCTNSLPQINPVSPKSTLIGIKTLSDDKSKKNNGGYIYINPANITSLEPSSKQKRLKESYTINGNDLMNETKISYNGKDYYIEGDVDSVASKLGSTGIDIHKLDTIA